MTKYFALACILLFSCSCGQKQLPAPVSTIASTETNSAAISSLPTRTIDSEAVGPGVKIQLSSRVDPGLNTSFQIPEDGVIGLPYEKTMTLVETSLPGLEKQVQELYAPLFRRAPDVKATIVDARRYVRVDGLVQKPGNYLVSSEASFQELIGLAGGAQAQPGSARSPRYVVVRDRNSVLLGYLDLDELYRGKLDEFEFGWNGGESAFLQVDPPVGLSNLGYGTLQVIGQVARPGEIPVQGQQDFYYYLSKVGGPTALADLENIEIIRFTESGKTSVRWEMSAKQTAPVLAAGDMVVVHAEKPDTALNRISSVIGTLSTALLAALAF